MGLGLILLGVFSKLVLIVLVGLSVWSVAIMMDRYRFFKSAEDKTAGLSSRVRTTLNQNQNQSTESIQYSFRAFLIDERIQLEKGLGVLATLGSNAPFIGLFGTVLGIIQAFGVLAKENSSGAGQVMSSLSEALIATAMGLLVAIPAVIAYNHFSQRLRKLLAQCESAKDRHLAEKSGN